MQTFKRIERDEMVIRRDFMEFNINSPVYFKEHYGVDDEVSKFCQKAYLFFIIEVKEYQLVILEMEIEGKSNMGKLS